jgi:hypothetical protein
MAILNPQESIEEMIETSPEVNQEATSKKLQLIIGILAFTFPLILIIGAKLLDSCDLVQTSISAYYHTIMNDFFVGGLCALGMGMIAYDRYQRIDYQVTNWIGVFTFGVAFFPTNVNHSITSCVITSVTNPFHNAIHYICASIVFILLGWMSLKLFVRTGDGIKPIEKSKIIRNKIYTVCGWVIFACIFSMLIYSIYVDRDTLTVDSPKVIFWLEYLALATFGVSWMVKSGLILTDDVLEKVE